MSILSKLWLRLRRFGVEVYCFFTAPFVVRNCLSMIAIASGLLFLMLWWLKCYTNHGESVQVPNYIGMNLREAQRASRANDFNLEVSDSIYIPDKPPGQVLSQNPKANSHVKEGRTIYITVAKNNPDVVRLPDLAGGDDYELYSRKCVRLGLKPRILAHAPDPKLEPNTIMAVLYRGDTISRTRLATGFQVEVGGIVDFVVSESVNETVNVPECICKTYDEAKFLLTSANLNVGTVVPDATVEAPETAYVWKQNPKYSPNEIMRPGESVDLYLTQAKPQGCP
jgi:beta-lactam-binding protein with PASTA domain